MRYTIGEFDWGDGTGDVDWVIEAYKWCDIEQEWVFDEYIFGSEDKSECEEELRKLTTKAQEN